MPDGVDALAGRLADKHLARLLDRYVIDDEELRFKIGAAIYDAVADAARELSREGDGRE